VWSVAWRRQARKKLSFCRGANAEDALEVLDVLEAMKKPEVRTNIVSACQARVHHLKLSPRLLVPPHQSAWRTKPSTPQAASTRSTL
jgi:hypothetical protein